MSETFYRIHSNPQAPTFSAENAWSGLWGASFSADGSQSECRECDGTGQAFSETCNGCGGEGWEDASYGYSCCWSAADLVAYMDEHGVVTDDDPVVVFVGQQVGTGFDAEPLAVPTGEIRWTTYGALRAGKE